MEDPDGDGDIVKPAMKTDVNGRRSERIAYAR
jgi:hypothetical protein